MKKDVDKRRDALIDNYSGEYKEEIILADTPHTAPGNILVVDDTLENLRLLVDLLAAHGYKVRPASDGTFALESARLTPPDLILLDIKMPGMDGYDVCARLKASELTRDIPVIFISALHDTVDKVKGFEIGGVDYITKPFQAEEVLARVRMHLLLYRLRHHLEALVDERTAELHREIAEHKATARQLQESLTEIQRLQAQLQAENIYLREEIQFEHNVENIIGHSQVLTYLLFRTKQVAPTDTTVLISGETGTGKELVARAIHHLSRRKERPLVKVNCAALPAHLIESELFGHEKGAFTGATAKRIGRFELADGATIFLDEIGEFPLELQAKLLRVLQEGELERLGSSQTIKVDVRVIAATNRDLEQEVQEGRFRHDLYYRLNVYPLSVPPLRERLDDIPLLVQALIQKFNKKLGKHIETIPQPTMHALQQYSWPGNVRELENLIERAMIITPDQTLRVELPITLALPKDSTTTLAATECAHILHVLEHTGWKINGADGAAARLGLHPSTLRSRMQKLGIKRTHNA